MNKRALHGEDFWKWAKADFEKLMAYRNAINGKPTEEQRLMLEIQKPWVSFYKAVL